MRHIPVYKAEISDGVADKVVANASIAYASAIEVCQNTDETKKQIAELAKTLANFNLTRATNEGQIDLFYMKSILATVGWNKNDDVFDKVETWAARATPEDKPLNYEHNQKDIIGHITGNYVTDLDGKIISNDTAIDDLPDLFHVVNSEVLYKWWSDKEQLERMKNIIAEIPEGKWFVSMEALFDNFDYAVVDPQGKNHVIARSKDSAFLTKHLRAYGGDGIYDGNKVGRLIRNIVFSGKGLVLRPANPHSIIFDSVNAFEKATSASVKEFKKVTVPTGYTLSDRQEPNKESSLMADQVNQLELYQNEIKRLEATLKTATDRAAEAEKRLNDMNAQAVQAKIDGLAADVKTRDNKITSLTAQVQTEQAARVEAEKKLTDTQAQLKEFQEKLAKAAADQAKSSRISVIVAELGKTQEEATQFYDTDIADLNMSDDRFKKFVATLKAQKPATPPPATATTQQTPPANNNGKTDATAATVLENAQPNKNPPLGTTEGVTSSVEQTRAGLAKTLASVLRRGKTRTEGDN